MWGKHNPPSWLFRPPASYKAIPRSRIAALASGITILVLIIFAFIATPRQWNHQNRLDPVSGIRPYTGPPSPVPWDPPHPLDSGSGWSPAERLIVKVRLEDEDVSWLEHIKWMWQNEVVTIQRMFSNSHFRGHRSDRGRVASAYLSWIIHNYHHLPETLVFLPPEDLDEKERKEVNGVRVHEDFDLKTRLRHFQPAFVQTSGFANLQCPRKRSQTTCDDMFLSSKAPSYEFRTLEAKIPEIWKALFGDGVEVPLVVASVLGSRFAVSKAQVQKRSVDDYLRYWTWLEKTIMDDDSSGLVFEYFWHIIFGKEVVYCPDRAKCECDVYGKCG